MASVACRARRWRSRRLTSWASSSASVGSLSGNPDDFRLCLPFAQTQRAVVGGNTQLRPAAIHITDVPPFTRGLGDHGRKVGIDRHVVAARIDMKARAGRNCDLDAAIVRFESARLVESAVSDPNVSVVGLNL